MNEDNPSRRDFLKTLGIAGAAVGVVGTVGMTAAGDALGASMSGGIYRRPWWVRQVAEPTTGIEWSQIERFDATNTLLGRGLCRYATDEENDRLIQVQYQIERQRMIDVTPGYTLRDNALQNAFVSVRDVMPRSFLGPQIAARPQDEELSRYEGTPEENAAMLKVAMQQMGAATVGVVRLDDNTRKLIYSVDPDGKRLEFEDVEHSLRR